MALIPLRLVLLLPLFAEVTVLAVVEGSWEERSVDSLRVNGRYLHLQHRRGDAPCKFLVISRHT